MKFWDWLKHVLFAENKPLLATISVAFKWNLYTNPKYTGDKMPPKYRHFSAKEAEGVEPDLMAMLDVAAERAGVPFIITCKGRTVEHNKEVGGVPDSAHVDDDGNGLSPAVDLACGDSQTRWKMVFALKDAGFRRIILEPRCIHVDNDPGKPLDVLGVYVAKT